ncbi:hypothetical protein [Streptococcus pneumoniae]|uniref:hypothetical protein n=1 Tax=Streptococcus pneumoniae TaxID=1313 RepID=UPI000B004021
MVNFMRAAVNEQRKYKGLPALTASEFLKLMREKRAVVELDNKLANRSVNEGFSGGEKKRNEIFQMAMLEPRLSILDETDSGLDIDALRIVAEGVNKLKTPETSTIVITHYQRQPFPLSAQKHWGYALQWFSMAAVFAGLMLWQGIKYVKRHSAETIANSRSE